MLSFLENISFRITPISPIHIGSGESVDWSTSIADENYLYILDFLNIDLPVQVMDRIKNISLNCRDEKGLLKLQSIYKEHRDNLIRAAHDKIALPPKLAEKFVESLGSNVQKNSHNISLNKLNVSRTACNANTITPYIPGSSVKGAIRTAYLSALASKAHIRYENRKKVLDEKRILGGAFATDPFRLLKVEDTISSKKNSTQVFYLVIKKRDNTSKNASGIPQYLEAIAPFNYGAFTGSLSLHAGTDRVKSGVKSGGVVRPPHLQRIIETVNRFNISMFIEQKRQLQNLDFVHKVWLDGVERLIKRMDKSNNMLIRLGKLCTAESKTVNGANGEVLREILIRNPKKPKNVRTSKRGTTFWMAGDFKSNSNLLPMGWAIIELGDTKNKELQDFCSVMAEKYSYALNNNVSTSPSHNIPNDSKEAINWLKKLLASNKSATKEELALPAIQLLKKAKKWPEDVRYELIDMLEEYDFGERQDDVNDLLDTIV